jgi:transposase
MNALEVETERIDDIPLLIAQQEKMGIRQELDEVIEAHGNRRGLSVGQLTTVWLSYILSEADHRMMVVEDWAAKRLMMLSELVGEEVRDKDFTDDRLADVLKELCQDEVWEKVETQLGQRLLQVYNLSGEPIRLDSTTVSVHHEEDGLFRRGYSKDRRPDLAQFKVMLGTLDPMGIPVATLIPPGNEADDGLYIPTIKRAQQVVGTGKQLYVGDSKMSALGIRAFVAQAGDYYLMPLPRRHQGPDELSRWLQPVLDRSQALRRVTIPAEAHPTGRETCWAVGYETTRQQNVVEGETAFEWHERVLIAFRPALARQERANLRKRLARAEAELLKLVPKHPRVEPKWRTLAELEAAAHVILKQYRVEGLLRVRCSRTREHRTIRKYRDRPERTETRICETITVQPDIQDIRLARRKLGWRLYVTNAPAVALPFERAILTYRDAPRIELDFRRIKGRPLGLRPTYTHRDDHTIGLARLLTLALRVLTLTEFVVREGLRHTDEQLAGLYPGQPSRRTSQPTTERLLKVFKGIDLSLVHLNNQPLRHVTPLTALQQRILDLLGLPALIYERLAAPKIPP